ncbi:MAG: acyltransferase [Agarilytica sp.]
MNYRADIDGIRAIAVTTVILFHYGVTGFSGGFVGVDIFFVLSGYLISSIIFDKLEKGRFEFGNFYFRRIRRLFPVYVVVMAVTFALAYAFMLPREFREFGQSLVASTVYISNILFFLEAGYFDTASHLKPLLHTWSLSVEEQFYVVFPFVAWLCARLSRKNLFIFFAILTLASFVAAVSYIKTDTSAVFYLYPFRAWEMFLGTLLATKFIPQLVSRLWNNIIAITGLVLVILPTFLYTDKTLFPGAAAFMPCFGTALLIYSGNSHQGWVQQILSSSIPVYIGKLSYSLYLWHWPLYVIYAYISPEGLSTLDVIMVAAATVTASYLSYRYIETPFRYGQFSWSNRMLPVFSATAVFSFVAMAAGFYLHKTNGMPQRLNAETAAFAHAGGDLFGDLSGCVLEDNNILPGIGFCPIGDPLNSESYTLIWGDSHGGAYKRGYESAINNNSQHALLAWTGGCPAVFGLEKDESVSSKLIDDQCPIRNNAILKLLKEDKRINSVVIVGRWSYYILGEGVGVDEHNKISLWPEGSNQDAVTDQARLFIDSFMSTLNTLKEMDKKVFVVEQPPEFERYVGRKIAIELMRGSKEIQTNLDALTAQHYSKVMKRQGPMQLALSHAENQQLATILNTHGFFCENDTCTLMRNGAPMYFDNNHVSSFGAEQINTMFTPVLQFLKQPGT